MFKPGDRVCVITDKSITGAVVAVVVGKIYVTWDDGFYTSMFLGQKVTTIEDWQIEPIDCVNDPYDID